MTATPAEKQRKWSAGDWCALATLSLISLAFFWPMLRDLGGTFVGVFNNKGDAEGTLWWNWWVRTALIDPAQTLWFTKSMFYPVGIAVAPLYGSVLNVLFYLPWMLLLPLPVHNNLWCLVIQLLDGVVAYWVMRRLVGSRWLAWAGAAVWLLAPFKFLEFRDGHLPQILLTFIPLAFYGLWRLREKPAWTMAALAGVALALDGCGYYQHLYGAFFMAAMFAVAGLWQWRQDKTAMRDYALGNLLIVGIVCLGIAVFYLPLMQSVVVGQDAPWTWAAQFPAQSSFAPENQPWALLQAGSLHLGRSPQQWTRPEEAFLLLLALAGLVAGLASRRRAVLPLVMGIFFTLIVIGPLPSFSEVSAEHGRVAYVWRNPLYIALYNYFPSFNRLYWPDTFWPYAVWCWAATLALAVDHWREQLRRAMPLVAVVIGGLTLAASIYFVRERPFIGPFVATSAPMQMAAESGDAFFSLPTELEDDYQLPIIVLTGKAMVGGRGRDLGYLEPGEFTGLAHQDPWLSALHAWSRREDVAAPSAETLQPWLDRGVRHLVLNRTRCATLDHPPYFFNVTQTMESFLRERVEPLLGPPAFADEQWLVYRLPELVPEEVQP